MQPLRLGPGETALGISVLLSTSFAVLLPVIPVIVERKGGAGVAGAATASLLATTVVSEFLAPVVMARVSPRVLVIAGMLFVGLPCIVYFIPGVSLAVILSATALRGVGVGVTGVVCMALAARHARPERRGASIGLYGTAFTLPFFAGPPLGLLLLANGLGGVAAAISGAAGVLGAAAGVLIHDDRAALPGVSLRKLVPPAAVLAVVPALVLANMTFGVAVTFLPLVLPVVGVGSAATFLLVSGIARVVARFGSGLLSDRFSPEPVMLAAVVAALLGLGGLALSPPGSAVVVIAAAIYGLGSGGVQTAAFLAMLKRGATTDVRVVTGGWNTAVDIGTGGGAAVFGLISAAAGLNIVLPLLPLLAAAAIVPALFLVRPARAAS
ncbi:MAG TPA: MFS transporter [Candidatus Dormibacteraeota bacterium]|nr:MFS transporter [Candidatus Dormibacteraeota bacterium]